MKGYEACRPVLLATLCATIATTHPANAQDTSDSAGSTTSGGDIVVTAQRREELLRDVPIAMTALNAETLDKAGVGNLQELERVTPGLALPLYGGFLRPSIRGISSGLSTIGDSSNVAIYLDGVYQPTQTAAIVDLPDVQSVQVLKGPQGTLYGQNATGGAIIIDTVTPRFDFGGEIVATYGNYDKKAAHGYVTGPIGANVAFLLSASGEDRGGYNRDLLRGGHDNGLRSWQVRGKLLLELSDQTSFTLAGFYSRRDDSGVYTGSPLNGNSLGNALTRLIFPGTPIATKPHEFATSLRPDLLNQSYGISLLGKIGLGGAGTLNTVTAYQHAKVTDFVDADAAPINLAEVRPLVIPGSALIQELNFVSNKFGGFTFSVGAFFMDRQERFNPSQFGLYSAPYENWTGSPSPGLEIFDYFKTKKKSYAGYVELNYDISDQLTATIAGRYSYERVISAHNAFGQTELITDPRGHFTFKKFTPRAVLRFKPNDYHTFYASYSKGFKSGFVDGAKIGACPGGPTDGSCIDPPVKPETVDAFEIGYKGRLTDGLDVSLAAFHYKYKQIQVFIYQPPTGLYQNAAAGRLNGFDFDMSWEATPDLRLAVGGSYVDSKYTDFPGASIYTPIPQAGCAAQFLPFPCGNVQGPADVTGNQLANAPKFTGTASIDYGFDTGAGRIGLNANGNYNSGFPFDVGGSIRQKKYLLVNGEISFEPSGIEGLRVSLWGKNLSGHAYIQGTLPTFAADLVSWAPPRTYGASAEFKF